VLTGKGGFGQVFSRRAGAHGDRTLPELMVGSQDAALDLRWDCGPFKGVSDGSTIGPFCTEHPSDCLIQAVVYHKTVIGRRGHDEAGRDRKASPDQLAQICSLAACYRNIFAPELMKRENERQCSMSCHSTGPTAG